MLFKNCGQALIESLMSLPLFIAFTSLVLIGLLQFANHYLADHSIYESALCAAKDQTLVCKKELVRRLKQLPFTRFNLIFFHVSPQQVHIKVHLTSFGNYSHLFVEKLSLPLTAKHFHEAQ